jgi:hypothetical protein
MRYFFGVGWKWLVGWEFDVTIWMTGDRGSGTYAWTGGAAGTLRTFARWRGGRGGVGMWGNYANFARWGGGLFSGGGGLLRF